jgi:hypothetical protein
MIDIFEKVKSPYHKAKSIWRNCKNLSSTYNCSPITIFSRALYFRVFHDALFDRAEFLELLNPETPLSMVNNYVSDKKIYSYFRRANVNGALVDNKAMLQSILMQHNFPTPHLIAASDKTRVFSTNETIILSAKDLATAIDNHNIADIVLKPVGDYGGNNILFLQKKESGDYTCQASNRYKIEDIYQRLKDTPSIIQSFEKNHSLLASISNTRTLQTVRFNVYCNKYKPIIISAFLRISASDALTDNWKIGKSGNLIALIDQENGCMSPAIRSRLDDIHNVHPITKNQITGIQLPFWDDCISLVLAISKLPLSVSSIGWDVAITPNGPKIIEGNTLWYPAGSEGPYFTPADFDFMCSYLDSPADNVVNG